MGSRVVYHDLNVYDLDPSGIGQFDLVVIGYVLQLVRDPLRALEAVRGVCRGWVLVLDTVSALLSLLPAPLARLCARPGPAGVVRVQPGGAGTGVGAGRFEVEAVTRILRDRPGPAVMTAELSWSVRARHALGLLGRSVAVRGSVPRQGCV